VEEQAELTYVYSLQRPPRRRLCRSVIDILGDWVYDGVQHAMCLHGVCILFPQSIGVGGRLSGTVVSETEVFLSDCFCDADCFVFV
jgi:hypothetical protein